MPENHKASQHESWLNRRAYRRHFDSPEPTRFFKNWPGTPDKCTCGCGAVEFSRSNPTNWWQSLSPKLLWETRFLFPLFRSLYGVLWELSAPIWIAFLSFFSLSGFKNVVLTNYLGNRLGTAMTPLRIITWFVFCLVTFALWVATWSLPRLGGATVTLLYVVSLALLTALLLVIWGLAATYIMLHGAVFLVGGIASILYLSNPVVGVVLIGIGVGLEYESKRRRERQHREEVGRVLRFVEERTEGVGRTP